MNFEFSTTSRIVFGTDTVQDVPLLASSMGNHVFLISNERLPHGKMLKEGLANQGMAVTCFNITGEPSIDTISHSSRIAQDSKCDMVIGIGGGSVLDSAKAISLLIANPGNILDYLEVIGEGKPFLHPSAPCIAIPTTAGTGAEVTRNAVLSSRKHRVKVSMRSPHLLPDLAVIDPSLTITMPPALTAHTGMDALTQLIESFVSRQANPLTDALCVKGLEYTAQSLFYVYSDGTSLQHREKMCTASLFSGLALANARLGAVHGFAGTIGGMYDMPHGWICACLLPHVMEVNLRAAKRNIMDNTLDRYQKIAAILTGESDAKPEDGIRWITFLCKKMQIVTLEKSGIKREEFPEIITRTELASSTKGNPVTLTKEELLEILEKAILYESGSAEVHS